MSNILLRKMKYSPPQLLTLVQHQCRLNASSHAATTTSSGSVVQQHPIVLDNNKAPPPLSADRVRAHPKIGNREIVGYGLKGKPEYFDLVMFPCPSIRWEADTPAIASLRQKEKGDWKQLSVEEKKKRNASIFVFSRHFPLFFVSVSIKFSSNLRRIHRAIGRLEVGHRMDDAFHRRIHPRLRRMASNLYVSSSDRHCPDVVRSFVLLPSGYRFDRPDSMGDKKLKRQMEYHIAARQGPVSGLSHKWDYETGASRRFSIERWTIVSLSRLGTWKK